MTLNSSGNYSGAESRKVCGPIRLQKLTEESKQRQEVARENSQEFQYRNSPNPVVPMSDIDQIDTENNLNAISQPLSFRFGMDDGLPIDEATTIRIPAITFPNRSRNENSETQNLEGGEYIAHIRKLIKNLGIYSLSSLASPLVSLILAPFLTRNLSHANYGALAVLNTAVALLTGLTQLGLPTAFFRSYNYDYESQNDRFGVLSTTVALLSLMSIFTAIATLIAAPWLSMLLFNNSSFIIPVRFVGVVLLLQNLAVPGFAWLRAENRAALFSALSIANLIVCIAANFILVGVLHMGISGSLIATGSGYAVVSICTLPLILLRAGIRPRIDIVQGLMSFGWPSVFTFLSIWVLQLSDRFLLARLGSLAQTASYAVAYSLGGVLSVVVLSPFTLAWPSTMFSIAKGDDAANIFRLVFRWYSIVLLFTAFGLSLASTIALELFFPPAYQAAAPIIPIIATSIMFYGVYITFMTGTYIRRKTWYAVVFTTTAALANVGLNIILIPLYGSVGAAVSTLIAYVLLALIGYVVNQRIYPVPYEIGLFVIGLLIGIALYVAIGYLARNEGRYEVWGIYIGVLVLYGGSLAFLGRLPTRSQKNKS
jgi:O-antigen/teichoic acid export membrane protein